MRAAAQGHALVVVPALVTVLLSVRCPCSRNIAHYDESSNLTGHVLDRALLQVRRGAVFAEAPKVFRGGQVNYDDVLPRTQTV